MKKYFIDILLVLIFIVPLIVTGCKDTGPGITDIPTSNVSYSRHIQPLFNSYCLGSGCHNDQDHAGGLSLTTWSSTTADYQVVAPGYPQNSKLVWRIEGTSGNIMPPIGSSYPLNQNQINGIKTWIKEGAKNN